jgi:hypothetical protein
MLISMLRGTLDMTSSALTRSVLERPRAPPAPFKVLLADKPA